MEGRPNQNDAFLILKPVSAFPIVLIVKIKKEKAIPATIKNRSTQQNFLILCKLNIF